MAEYKVTLNMPNLAPGAEVDVTDVGVLVNGETSTVEMHHEHAAALKRTPGFEVESTATKKKGGDKE